SVKRHTPVGELLPVWQAEVEGVGWPVRELAVAVDRAAENRAVPERLADSQVERIVTEVVTATGDLSRRKVFTRAEVIVAVAPHVYGSPVDELRRVVDAVFASPEIVPLLRAGA